MKKILFIILLLISSDILWAQKMTIYVAPNMIRCKGMLEVQCFQIKDSPNKEYDTFVSSIEGFTRETGWEEGYNFKLLVDKGVYENSPPDNPSVYFKLIKILSKTLPNDTILVANRKSICEDTKIFDCLLYKHKNENEWHNLYGKIKGFKYKEGYDYELLVSKKLNSNDGGGNTYDYSLIKTLSKKATMIISKTARENLDKRKFILSKYRDEKGEYQDAGGSPKPITLSFNLDENLVTGNDGCNELSSKIEINNSKISFGPIMATKMFCPNMSMDRIVQTNLAKVNKYKIEGGILKLYGNNKLLFEYNTLMEDLQVPKKN